MKPIRLIVICVCLGSILPGSLLADRDKERKLPIGAYITQAKIEILSGEPERYQTAIAMLDSLFYHYGHHAEGLFWMSQIYVDFIEKTAGPREKAIYVEKFVAYVDTLKMTCASEDINKKYKKDCKEFIEKSDSTAVKYWREFYNAGVEQLDEIRVIAADMKADPDSVARAFYQEKLNAFIDSCEANMNLALIIDSTVDEPYIGLASVYEQRKEPVKANALLMKALERSDKRDQLLLMISYNFINQGEYCEAIPYLRDYVDLTASDIDNMYNLAAVYNRCNMYDSALLIYRRVLEQEPDNTDALVGAGRYYNQVAKFAMDSSSHYRELGDQTAERSWMERRDHYFDTAKVYFAKAFDLDPDSVFVAEEYAILCYITEDYQSAITPFLKLTELEPQNPDHWTSLGDCYLKTQQWDKSARAYEKVIEIDPNSIPIWESLEALYKQLGETENLKKAQEKLKG